MSITTLDPPIARRDGRMVSRVEIVEELFDWRAGRRVSIGHDKTIRYEVYCEQCGELLTGLEHAEAMTEFDEHVCEDESSSCSVAR